MGSRILSRSFHVEEWKEHNSDGEDEDDDDHKEEENHEPEDRPDPQSDDKMTVDGDEPAEPSLEHDEEEDSDDEVEDTSDVTMVPMADMLNARNGCDNVCISDPCKFSVDSNLFLRPGFFTRSMYLKCERLNPSKQESKYGIRTAILQTQTSFVDMVMSIW